LIVFYRYVQNTFAKVNERYKTLWL